MAKLASTCQLIKLLIYSLKVDSHNETFSRSLRIFCSIFFFILESNCCICTVCTSANQFLFSLSLPYWVLWPPISMYSLLSEFCDLAKENQYTKTKWYCDTLHIDAENEYAQVFWHGEQHKNEKLNKKHAHISVQRNKKSGRVLRERYRERKRTREVKRANESLAHEQSKICSQQFLIGFQSRYK